MSHHGRCNRNYLLCMLTCSILNVDQVEMEKGEVLLMSDWKLKVITTLKVSNRVTSANNLQLQTDNYVNSLSLNLYGLDAQPTVPKQWRQLPCITKWPRNKSGPCLQLRQCKNKVWITVFSVKNVFKVSLRLDVVDKLTGTNVYITQ